MHIWRILFLAMAVSLVAACSSGPSNLRQYSEGRTVSNGGSGWAPASTRSTRASGAVNASGLIASSSDHQKVGRAYTVAGRTYRPQRNDGYDETGIASWYGPNFHGRPTANGETFDQHAMTAAHTTLPIPSIVEVTNLENGRSVIVRLNDRGPFVDNRLIDLSRAAATELDYIGSGLAHVRVRYLGPAHEDGSPPNRVYQANADPTPARIPAPVQVAETLPPVAEPMPQPIEVATPSLTRSSGGALSGEYSLQLGAFSDQDNARQFARRLDGAGDVWIEAGNSQRGQVWRVFFGRWADRTAAQSARTSLADWGIYESRIVATR
ncbi:MAG: rare lipoprotein A [Maricaulis maris]|jgi:rare lipoprotein A